MFGNSPHEWVDFPNRFYDYNGPLVTPTPGAAKPVDNSLGGLLFVKMRPVHHVVPRRYRPDRGDRGDGRPIERSGIA